MTEEVTTESPPLETTTATESFIGENYELKEGWKDALIPEELRGSSIYNNIKDVKGAFSIIGNQAKLVGRKNTIPDDKSSEGDWNTFYEAWGRPKTVDDYKLEPDEFTKDYFDEESMKGIKDSYHKAGLNQKQAEIMWQNELARAQRLNKYIKDSTEMETRKANAMIDESWGIARKENEHIVLNMLNAYGNFDKPIEKLEITTEADAKMAIFLHNIGSKLSEHKVLTDVYTPVADLQMKINELMSDPAYENDRHPRHKDVAKQVSLLFEEKARREKRG